MKIAHISDLHLGKTLHGFSLIEDQEFILNQIFEICVERKVEVLLVAGDIFDRSVASIEGINLLRKFLNNLVGAKIKVLLISGNHDSADRLTFGAEFMTEHGIYFSKIYDGNISPISFDDEFGKINFYLLPFLKPSQVKHYFVDEKIEGYEDAISVAIKQMQINATERNVIVAHQNIGNPQRCESEEFVIGGLDAISADVFKEFDYTALGHIHKPQKIATNVYFSGTPLKYSTSEIDHEKTMPIITLSQKGEIDLEFIPLKPMRDLRQITGKLNDIIKASKNDPNNPEDFIDIILTDEETVLDALSKLREVYKNVIKITYDNKTTKALEKVEKISVESKNPLDVFEEFFKSRKDREMDSEEKKYIEDLIEKIFGEK